jgi:hypothetical protein
MTEPTRPPMDLADLIDAENPPQMYYVPDSKGFERRISRHIRANRQTLESALHAVAHAVPFEDSGLNIAQILAMGLSSLPENDESREWMENAVGICLGAIVEAANHQTLDTTAPTPET